MKKTFAISGRRCEVQMFVLTSRLQWNDIICAGRWT